MIRKLAATFVLSLAWTQAALAKPPDACKLLGLGDVEAQLGKGFEPAPGGLASDYSMCTYRRGAKEVAGLMVLGGGSSATVALKERARMLGPKAIPVTGLGEGAFRVRKDAIAGVWFGKGVWQLNLEVKGSSEPSAEAVRKLAEIVLSRVP